MKFLFNLLLLLALGLIGCGRRPQGPGAVLDGVLKEQKLNVHSAINLPRVEADVKLLTPVAATCVFNGRQVFLSSAPTYVDVGPSDLRGFSFDVHVHGSHVDWTRSINAPGSSKEEEYKGNDAVLLRVMKWSATLPPVIDLVAVTGGESGKFGADYQIQTDSEFFIRGTVLKHLYLDPVAELMKAADSALLSSGLDETTINCTWIEVYKDYLALSDRDRLLAVLASRGDSLSGETNLKQALRIFMLQSFIDPEWAVSFEADGNEIIAIKRQKRTKLGISVFYDEFNAGGMWQASGSIELKDSGRPQDVANAIARFLGTSESPMSDSKPK